MTTTLVPKEVKPDTYQVTFRHGKPLRLMADDMSREEFYEFCQNNNELRIERTADNQLIIMPPTASETGHRNAEISTEITIWNRQTKLGLTFDSSTGFTLPNGAERAPDTAWMLRERWEELPVAEKRRFAHIVPDFIIELRSEDQSLNQLREKMDEYMSAGCRLSWLIDPQNRRTYVYYENGNIQTIAFDEPLFGNDVMPGLSVRLADII